MLSKNYKYIWINILMLLLIFFVATNSILSNYGFSGLTKLDSIIGFNISNLIYILTGISIIVLATNKKTWLPFLGDSILPANLIPETKNVGDNTIKIKIKPNTKVAYWSALQSIDKKPNVEKAYGNYLNAGVSKSDKNGFAILTFNKPSGYIVPSGRYIKPHIHYRELNNDLAMMGPVKTLYL